MDYQHSLKDYLSQIHHGQVIDTKSTEERKPSFLERALSRMLKPKLSPADEILVKTFNDLGTAAEEEKKRLGEDLLEDFTIRGLPYHLPVQTVYQQSMQHLASEGYNYYGVIGRGKLLKNSEGANLSLIVSTGAGYISARVQRIRSANHVSD